MLVIWRVLVTCVMSAALTWQPTDRKSSLWWGYKLFPQGGQLSKQRGSLQNIITSGLGEMEWLTLRVDRLTEVHESSVNHLFSQWHPMAAITTIREPSNQTLDEISERKNNMNTCHSVEVKGAANIKPISKFFFDFGHIQRSTAIIETVVEQS